MLSKSAFGFGCFKNDQCMMTRKGAVTFGFCEGRLGLSNSGALQVCSWCNDRILTNVSYAGELHCCKKYYPSSNSHVYVGSMHDDIRLHVTRSHTSSTDSPFYLMSSCTFVQPSSLRSSSLPYPCTLIMIALLPT